MRQFYFVDISYISYHIISPNLFGKLLMFCKSPMLTLRRERHTIVKKISTKFRTKAFLLRPILQA